MTPNAKRASHGRRPVPSLAAKEWPEARELVRTMSGAAVKEYPAGCEVAAFLFDFLTKCAQVMPRPNYFTTLERCGVWFRGYTHPREYPEPLAAYVSHRKPRPQQCYYNSTMALLLGPAEELGLSYFEGWMCLPRLNVPIEHAWLGTDAGGVAVDLTLPTVDRDGDEQAAEMRAGTVYCGMRVPPGFLNRLTVTEALARPRLGDWIAAAVDYVKGLE